MKNKKSLGQHWLYNRSILNEIADLAVVAKNTAKNEGSAEEIAEKTEVERVCLEIGPGLGTLTSSLLRRFDKVVAVEFDADLAKNLPKSFPGKNLEVVNEDILKFDFGQLKKGYVVAGNIPYYITSPIIEKLLKAEPRPEKIVLLIQKEVAERIVDNKQTMLSLFVKNRAEAKLGPLVLKEEFTPPPKVDSEVIILEPHEPLVEDDVFDLIRRGFVAPRKKLVHNLVGMAPKEELERILEELGINQNARPGDLQLKDWARLKKVI